MSFHFHLLVAHGGAAPASGMQQEMVHHGLGIGSSEWCCALTQVTGSDDKTWKMWHLPKGDLIMSGEGHTDWVAGVAFHPKVTLACCTLQTCAAFLAFRPLYLNKSAINGQQNTQLGRRL